MSTSDSDKHRIKSCDVGSLPTDEEEKLREGADLFATNRANDSARFFERTVLHAVLDKLKAGIAVPTFPQFRDMNAMFLSTLEGLERTQNGYVIGGKLALTPTFDGVPEVRVIERHADYISRELSRPFNLRICITGPYTLASFFHYRGGQTFKQLRTVLSEILEKSTFSVKHGRVSHVSIDEPLFGLIDDPVLDRSATGRETLLQTWESLANQARRKLANPCIHLHCTSDDLFWDIKSLRIIETHVDDPLFDIQSTKRRLEETDKLMKASIAISDFDRLVAEKMNTKGSESATADAWKRIKAGALDPENFLEDTQIMKKRLSKTVGRFGVERIALAGPECGLRSFPTYSSALECLKRVSRAVNLQNDI
jgi:5-methyltetrahydropteroyltriglutamate--homocysteine methyltransferase